MNTSTPRPVHKRVLSWPVAVAVAALTLAQGAASAVPSGQPAPDCALVLSDQDPAMLSALRGQVVYLDFWASWCGPCALSFPFMNNLEAAYRARGLRVVAVNMDERGEDAQRFLQRRPANFAVAEGDNTPCARAFGVPGMPATYLIDRNGIVRHTHSGFRRGDAERLRAEVETLLAEPARGAQP